jgi:hypothetical protein
MVQRLVDPPKRIKLEKDVISPLKKSESKMSQGLQTSTNKDKIVFERLKKDINNFLVENQLGHFEGIKDDKALLNFS